MSVRRVCLDAFGTVFSPRRPVFEQYAQVARTYGLSVSDVKVKAGFKRAFKQWAAEHPLYGKHSNPPLRSTEWWQGVIQDTFRFAGVPQEELEPVQDSLAQTLVRRFWGQEAYALHDEVPSFLRSLERLGLPPPAIVSNTDPVLSTILENLGCSETVLGKGGVRTEEIYTTWDIELEKQDVAFWDAVLERLNRNVEANGSRLRPEDVLVVGDELVADYETPRAAGHQSLLLRRLQPGEEHANPSYVDEHDGERKGIETVGSLTDVVRWLEQDQSRSSTE
ncbi:hypothetical protein JCM10212_002205 [Sporobolomyces blumeae]